MAMAMAAVRPQSIGSWRETGRDKLLAAVLSLLIHGLFVALVAIGVFVSRPEVYEAAGEPIEAELIDLPRAPPPSPAPRPAPPRPTPKPPAAPPPKPVTTPASRPEDVTDLRPPVAPPVTPDPLAEPDPAQQRQREERERRQQLEKIRQEREELARQRAEAERKLAEAERLRQEQDRRAREEQAMRERLIAEEAAALRGTRITDDLRARYVSVLVQRLEQAWIRPPGSRPNVRCQVRIRQIPGGEVIARAIVEPCAADAILRDSMLAAVDRASPLPYEGFATVFSPEILVPMDTSGPYD